MRQTGQSQLIKLIYMESGHLNVNEQLILTNGISMDIIYCSHDREISTSLINGHRLKNYWRRYYYYPLFGMIILGYKVKIIITDRREYL